MYTQDDLNQLVEAKVSGVSSITTQGGRVMVFRTIPELNALIKEVQDYLGSVSPTPAQLTPNKVRSTFCK